MADADTPGIRSLTGFALLEARFLQYRRTSLGVLLLTGFCFVHHLEYNLKAHAS